MTTPRVDTSPSWGTLAAALRNQAVITYADLRESRVGLLQDVGADRIIWMALPWWAPAGAGIQVATYTRADETPSSRRLQMLPIEGLLQWIPPRVQSQMRTLSLASDPDGGTEPTADQIWTAAQIRQRVIIGNAGLRVAWHEDYAVHGGPYGLFEASLNRDLALTFVEWQLLAAVVRRADQWAGYNGVQRLHQRVRAHRRCGRVRGRCGVVAGIRNYKTPQPHTDGAGIGQRSRRGWLADQPGPASNARLRLPGAAVRRRMMSNAIYTVPYLRHTIGGVEYEFRADIRFHAFLTECLYSQPERMLAEYDDAGNLVGRRLLFTYENILDCLRYSGEGAQPGTDWVAVCDGAPPEELLQAFGLMFGLMTKAGMDTDGSDEAVDDPKEETPTE